MLLGMGVTLVVKVNTFLFTSFALFISVYHPSQLKKHENVALLNNLISDCATRLLFPMVLFTASSLSSPFEC